jgi:nucleoside-diphosphate-sugar epimerase
LRILVIGGTQLAGPHVVSDLLRPGHHVTTYHRGNHPDNVPSGVEKIVAPREPGPPVDRYHLAAIARRVKSKPPDAVVHMIAFTREDAAAFVAAFTGLASRAVVVSSSDVYRPMEIINRTEPGPPVPVPIDENGELRRDISLHGMCDKRWVEQVVSAAPNFPATNERAAGRVYNVGELNVPAERQRLEHFARAAGWRGKIVEVADEILPGADGLPFSGQDWLLDTTRIRAELGFAEVSDYEEGIRATIDWQRLNQNPALKPADFDYAAEDRFLLGTR